MDFARRNFEIDAGQRPHSTEGLAGTADDECRRAAHFTPQRCLYSARKSTSPNQPGVFGALSRSMSFHDTSTLDGAALAKARKSSSVACQPIHSAGSAIVIAYWPSRMAATVCGSPSYEPTLASPIRPACRTPSLAKKPL